MNQSKWFASGRNIQVEDIVLFKKIDSTISKIYQFGIIARVDSSKDDVVRKVMVRYCNSSENKFRGTFRSVRELVLIRSVDDLNLHEEMTGL